MGYDKIVVGYDGSGDADRAIAAAADEVTPDGIIHVVTGFHPETNTQLGRHLQEIPEEFRYVYDPASTETEAQERALEALRQRGIECTGHVVPDDPATAIIEVAEREGAELVVVGSRGLAGVKRFLRGSVSARVATHAPMSVLIVHGPTTRRSD